MKVGLPPVHQRLARDGHPSAQGTYELENPENEIHDP